VIEGPPTKIFTAASPRTERQDHSHNVIHAPVANIPRSASAQSFWRKQSLSHRNNTSQTLDTSRQPTACQGSLPAEPVIPQQPRVSYCHRPMPNSRPCVPWSHVPTSSDYYEQEKPARPMTERVSGPAARAPTRPTVNDVPIVSQEENLPTKQIKTEPDAVPKTDRSASLPFYSWCVFMYKAPCSDSMIV